MRERSTKEAGQVRAPGKTGILWGKSRTVVLTICFLVFGTCLLGAEEGNQHREQPLSIDPQAFAVIYSGQERMHFSVSWSGGVKIGDLVLAVTKNPAGKGLVIKARVTDYGLFKLFYPVDDTFSTFIQGPLMLPTRYEVNQQEGSRKVQRLTLYDQGKFQARYRKHQNPLTLYQLNGPAYNEFSAFFITRALNLRPEEPQTIPTFADKKRHQVVANVLGREQKNTIFGQRKTIKVMPKMHFKGLYDKDGDTVFWLIDDACRVPVEIRSKILIGSLVAELEEYDNPACQTVLP
ncbi:MAG: DUF3108 domain-containing protein [Candidatus Electrothrix scaldis]|nr:MAG: DUF3108 domain-containing protein [Candidatus Electrothrix sp. GW3-3]